ncbi:Suppressor of the cold-sensitive snRNP bioproteinsis mutant brr1-1 [Perkinsus chesapeaki]|uniref:subtilisin n=1 Tax=Perkinsus chesapeaki TaxID=330153 RepID=A0A7J6LFH8_PERCH|nr:Suppressor of the cold-sensitive snRNP bioproteinsis mutant brr1-1 [Perkinsus chesapeaki]
MRFLSALPPIWLAASQGIYDDSSIVSIIHDDGSLVDVANIPTLLADAGVEGDQRVASFLLTSLVRTLKFAQCQIVPTSVDTLSNVDLCAYLNETRRYLSNHVIVCGKNVIGRMTRIDNKLNVDDPRSRWQYFLRRMGMRDVWELLQEYPRKNVTVAVIDQGVDFTDQDLAPLKSSFVTSDGKAIDGGWNFWTNSSKLTV